MSIDARIFQHSGGRFCGWRTRFAAAETEEHNFGFLLERRGIADFVRADAPAAEETNVRKRIEVRHRDLMRLHGAHGKTGHGAMLLIADGPEIRVDVRNQIIEQKMLERGDIKAAATAGTPTTRTCARPGTTGTSTRCRAWSIGNSR